MAEIRPFKGVVYDEKKVGGDLSLVMAPPYDVISEKQREDLYDKSDLNIVRLILGKDMEGDNAEENKYTRARDIYEKWLKFGVMSRDEEPSFYVYEQDYVFKGRSFSRIGFLGLMKIGEPENDDVMPHEHTLSKPKEDRLNLIKQVKSNLSPIFTLFNDKEGTVTAILNKAKSSKAVLDIEIGDQKHRMWRLSDADDIKKICSFMEGEKVFIADGHHRYAVSRSYRNLMKKKEGYDGSADHVMMYFADMSSSENLTVMATHRVIKKMSMSSDEVIAKLSEYFDVVEESDLESLIARIESASDGKHIIGFYDGKRFVAVSPKDEDAVKALIKEDRSDSWKELDVSILHASILDTILGIGSIEGNITYVRDAEDAVELVDKGCGEGAFILNPTQVDQLKAVAELSEMMPQKSTYFYPKLLTGLVINQIQCSQQYSNTTS